MNQRWYRVFTPSVHTWTEGFLYFKHGDSMNERQKGTLYVSIAAVLYSIGGLCMKVIPWSGLAINGGRTVIALITIGIYLFIIKHPLRFNRWILLGAIAVSGTNILFSVANKMTTAANAIVLEFTAPIFLILFSAFVLKKRPQKLDIAACIVVFGGIIFFFADSLAMGKWLGNFFALLSGVTYAVVFLMNDMPDADAISSVFWGNVISAVIGVPFIFRETDFSFIPMLSLVILGVFQVAIAYIFLVVGLKTTQPVTACLVSGIEPVLNPILVAVFYKELMSSYALIGAAIVILGVVIYNVLKARIETSDNNLNVNTKENLI